MTELKIIPPVESGSFDLKNSETSDSRQLSQTVSKKFESTTKNQEKYFCFLTEERTIHFCKQNAFHIWMGQNHRSER